MELIPTNVLIKGRRVWLQDANPAETEFVNYHSSIGNRLQMEYKETLPKKGPIHDGPGNQDAGNPTGTE